MLKTGKTYLNHFHQCPNCKRMAVSPDKRSVRCDFDYNRMKWVWSDEVAEDKAVKTVKFGNMSGYGGRTVSWPS